MGLSKQITNYGIIRGLLFDERVSVNMNKWAWIGQQDEIFKEYFIDTCRNPTFGRVWGWHSHSRNGDLGVLQDSRNFRVWL
jgi:hypothetical protein